MEWMDRQADKQTDRQTDSFSVTAYFSAQQRDLEQDIIIFDHIPWELF